MTEEAQTPEAEATSPPATASSTPGSEPPGDSASTEQSQDNKGGKEADGSESAQSRAQSASESEPSAPSSEEIERWKANSAKWEATQSKVPLNAGDYSLDVVDAKWPSGDDFKIDPESPVAIKGREWAKEAGLSGAQFDQAKAIFAQAAIDMIQRAEEAQVAAGEQAMARLANPDIPEADRVSAGIERASRVEKWLTETSRGEGQKAGPYAALADALRTPEAVVAMEKLIEKAGGPRSGPSPTTGQAALDWTKQDPKALIRQGWNQKQ